ncbi:hypothetical protein [Conchiformibius steedae]|uniref:hypothetical protein n=1 Tax=Conchiformibius steedae TaxID=153493 RepID=UPI0026ED3F5B|nr:hypothetical protein [Conchiformibius steedae]
MAIRFETAEDNGIVYHFADFRVANIDYMAVFSDDAATLLYFQEEETLAHLMRGKRVYSIKFAVKSYLEQGNEDLYAPPPAHGFGKTEIIALKKQLEQLVWVHYQQFQPDAYLFVAERPSLKRMYQKMCTHLNNDMLDFVPIMNLGEYQDCFFIQTPHYQEAS